MSLGEGMGNCCSNYQAQQGQDFLLKVTQIIRMMNPASLVLSPLGTHLVVAVHEDH